MAKLSVFNSVTLDGYFSGKDGDLRWAHEGSDDPEWKSFVAGNASTKGTLLLGRVTYELMVSYWPTPQAAKNDPEVARGMNTLQKVVFSRTLKDASWENTTLLKGDLAKEVRRLKKESAEDLVILGSGSIVSQLTEEGLIDEYRIVVTPIALGEGRTMFEGMKKKLPVRLTESRDFKNGRVLLCYEKA